VSNRLIPPTDDTDGRSGWHLAVVRRHARVSMSKYHTRLLLPPSTLVGDLNSSIQSSCVNSTTNSHGLFAVPASKAQYLMMHTNNIQTKQLTYRRRSRMIVVGYECGFGDRQRRTFCDRCVDRLGLVTEIVPAQVDAVVCRLEVVIVAKTSSKLKLN
jgi:hypothetical protein